MATPEDIKNAKELNNELGKTPDLIEESVINARDLTTTLGAALQEITSSNVGLGEARKAYRSLIKTTQTIGEIQNDISRKSVKELEILKAKTKADLDRLSIGAELLENATQLNEFELGLKVAAEEGFENEKKTINLLQQEIDKRTKIEEKLGLTGSTLENLNRIGIRALGGLGINLGTLSKNFEEARDAAESTAASLVASDKEGGKFKVLGAALPGVGKALKTALVDPLTVSVFSANSLKKAFIAVQKANVDLGRLTGQTEINASNLNTRLATSVQYLEMATELTKELGINANNAFSSDVLAASAEIQNTMGISAKEAGKLAIITQTTSGDFDSVKNSLVDSVSAFNRSNKAAVSQGVILRDVANTSSDILVSFNNQPGALAEAAAAARRLGLDLAKVDAVATSLLDFESSINNELQAQLLTGKNINLEKAREFALSNDLKGLSNELFSNSASIAEFSSMNRIAQEAQAKALGLNRQELAKIALQQSLNLGLSNKALEAAAGVTAEDLERVELQKQLELSIQKISQALVGPAALLASMAESTGLLYTALAATAGISLVKLVGSLAAIAGATLSATAALTLGLGAAAIVGMILAVSAAQKKATKDLTTIDDGIIDSDGGLVVSGPKGSIQLNSNDSVVAGTNLGGTPQWAERLIAAVERGGNVYIDGNRAGEALVLGTYKSS